jgi:hypothetical protein
MKASKHSDGQKAFITKQTMIVFRSPTFVVKPLKTASTPAQMASTTALDLQQSSGLRPHLRLPTGPRRQGRLRVDEPSDYTRTRALRGCSLFAISRLHLSSTRQTH